MLGDLEELDLSDNRLADIPEGISKLTKLKVLRLDGNVFEKTPSEVGLLESLETLTI